MPGQPVEAIADARVVAARASGRPRDAWFADELRVGGIRANAAAAATIEVECVRGDAIRRYIERSPDRAALVQVLVDALTRSA
jgi:hypothetical protein